MSGPARALEPLHEEAGGHRWQREPPGERRGRIHSSTVTVAVLEPCTESAFTLSEHEVQMRFTRDRGPGGQHKNKTDSCVVLTHLPTGLTVKVDGRNQHENRRQAWSELERRIRDARRRNLQQERDAVRAVQVGRGERGDKIRTYREQDARVTDHRTGASARLADIKAGRLELLHRSS